MKKIFKIKVVPRASRNKIIKLPDGYKVYLTAPPFEGKANQKLLEIMAKELNVSKSEIEIVKGLKGKEKVIKII